MIDAVVGHHLNPYRSGVARFNQLLAERLGATVLGLEDPAVRACRHPLLSFKVAEVPADRRAALGDLLDGLGAYGAFLHAFEEDDELQTALVRRARPLLAGNHELAVRLRALGLDTETAWVPGLVLDTRRFRPAQISVFSFGMAHKLQVERFSRLRELLEAGSESYALYLSNANHETARIEDQEAVFAQMRRVFPTGLYFMGNLSDVAVFNHLQQATFFAAFFRDGARANNTSIASALEHGAVVITNLDEHSPPEYVHMDNMIDIDQAGALPIDPLVLRRISVRAMETARARSWDALVRHVDAATARAGAPLSRPSRG